MATMAANRPEKAVRLFGGFQTYRCEWYHETIGLGHTLFGENRAQALRDKYDVVAHFVQKQVALYWGICKIR